MHAQAAQQPPARYIIGYCTKGAELFDAKHGSTARLFSMENAN